MSTENKPRVNSRGLPRFVGRHNERQALKPGFVRVGESLDVDFDLVAQFKLPTCIYDRWVPQFQVTASDHSGRTIGHALVGSSSDLEEFGSVLEVLGYYASPGIDVVIPLLWQCRLSSLIRDVDILRCQIETDETDADIRESGWQRIGGGTSFVRLVDFDDLQLLNQILQK